MLFGLIAIIVVFMTIQLRSFSKLIVEEFGSMEAYLKKIQKAQSSKKLQAFKKNLMYQSLLLVAIVCIGLFLDQI
jgi:hypothetical protein